MKRNLTREERLKGFKNLQQVFKTATKVEVKGLKMLYAENDLNYNRIAIVTGRSFGYSVSRNRAKRHVREAYRNIKGEVKSGLDIIIFPQRGNYSYNDRLNQLYLAFRKGKLVS